MSKSMVEQVRAALASCRPSTGAGPVSYDALYVESGFEDTRRSIQWQRAQATAVQELNRLIQLKAVEGFTVAECKTIVESRQDDPLIKNMMFHALLSKTLH